jgi:hypothetical protein
MVASGRQIDTSDRTELDIFRKRTSRNVWQPRSWSLIKQVPELSFTSAYTRDAMSRVVPIPAILSEDPSELPVPLDADTAPPGLDPDLCTGILERLAPFPSYMGAVAQNLDATGEVYVGLVSDADEIDGERCRVFSTDELISTTDGWKYRRSPDDSQGNALNVGDQGYWRIWQPDGQWSDEPWSHMIAMLGIGEELLLLTRAIRALAQSRIAMAGGYLFIPEEMSLETATATGEAPTEDAGDGEARTDTFIEDLMTAAEAAIMNPDSPSAILRLIIRGPAALGEKIKPIDLDRTIDETTLKLRAELIGRIANGVNLPREVVLGIGATNHWNAEEIRNQTWRNHLEPRAMSICSATTEAFYRPQLLANGVDPQIVKRCVIWYDPSWFIGTPDLTEHAGEAYENFELSGDAYRRVYGFAPDDAPSLDEVKARIWREQQINVAQRVTATEEGQPSGVIEPAPEGAGDAPVDDATVPDSSGEKAKTPVKVPDAVDTNAPKPMMAAAAPSKLDKLGAKLVGIERDLRTRLHTEANQVATTALVRAGMKIKSKIRNDSKLAAQIQGVDHRDIAATVGPAVVISLGLQDHDLLAGALAGLEPQYHRQVRRAQHAAAAAAAQAADEEFDTPELDRRIADSRDDGWTLLAAGITTLVGALLYDPHPQAPAHGEFDDTTVIPVGLIRAALDRAGGAQVGAPAGPKAIPAPLDPRAPGAPPIAGGATAGPTMLDEFKTQLGIVDDHYEWVYGDAPRREFPPHLDLDGVTFLAWDDDVLANTSDDWLGVDFLSPGDHTGCECDYAISFTQAESASE